MSKRIYIAGPISKGPIEKNIRQAEDAYVRLSAAGFAPHCPHWSCFSGNLKSDYDGGYYARPTQSGGLGLDHDAWLRNDMLWVEAAHAVLRLPGESKGADMETAHAKACGIPVCHAVEEVIAQFTEYPEYHTTGSPSISTIPVGGTTITIVNLSKPRFPVGTKVRLIRNHTPSGVFVIEETWVGRGKDMPARLLALSAKPYGRTYENMVKYRSSVVGPEDMTKPFSIAVLRRIM